MEIKRITKKDEHAFFGYYNMSPWNIFQDKILAGKPKFIDRHPTPKDILELGYFKGESFTRIDETCSWNWQQGCMLQWIPGSNTEIIYNKRKGKKFISVIYNTKTKRKKEFPLPIYSIHPSKKYALSLNFSRLNDVRKGYGYEGGSDIFKDEKIPRKDGIYLLNLKTKKHKLIVSIRKLSKIMPEESMKFGKHWVNHISFSPTGERFCFFYRWQLPQRLFYTRLVTSDLSGKNIKILASGGEFSHVDWISEEKLLGWGSSSSSIKKIKANISATKLFFGTMGPIVKKFLPKKIRNKITKQGYMVFDDKTGIFLRANLFNEDGHPSISPNKEYILTDTYSDKTHHRKLLLYNLKTKQKKLLGKFYSLPGKKYSKDEKWDKGGLRCDLHPRWSPKGDRICFDSVHEGFRGMYEIKING